MATVMAHTSVRISTGGWVPRQPAAHTPGGSFLEHPSVSPQFPFTSTQWSASGIHDVPALAFFTAFAVC